MDIDIQEIKEEFPDRDIEIKQKEPSKYDTVSVLLINTTLILSICWVAIKVTPWALLVFLLGGAETTSDYDIKISSTDKSKKDGDKK